MWQWKYNGLSLAQDLTNRLDQGVVWLDRWRPLMTSHYHAKFDGHKHWRSGDMFLVIAEEESICLFESAITYWSLKYMACHVHTQNFRRLTRKFTGVSKEAYSVLVTYASSNNWCKRRKNIRLPEHPERTTRREEKRKRRKALVTTYYLCFKRTTSIKLQ